MIPIIASLINDMITFLRLQHQLESLDRRYFFPDHLSVCPYRRYEL